MFIILFVLYFRFSILSYLFWWSPILVTLYQCTVIYFLISRNQEFLSCIVIFNFSLIVSFSLTSFSLLRHRTQKYVTSFFMSERFSKPPISLFCSVHLHFLIKRKIFLILMNPDYCLLFRDFPREYCAI